MTYFFLETVQGTLDAGVKGIAMIRCLDRRGLAAG
jgi:hypothetical protein